MRKKYSYLLLLCLGVILIPNLAFPTNACNTAYESWTWSNGTNSPIQLSVQMCSKDFQERCYAKDVAFVWNDISSQIDIGPYSYAGETNENPEDINIHSGELTGTTVGYAHIYKKNLFGAYVEVSQDVVADIVQARITLSPSLLSYPLSALLEKTVTHEIGHCLALKHPSLNGCTAKAVMQQSDTTYFATTVQQHDKNNLIAKWGK